MARTGATPSPTWENIKKDLMTYIIVFLSVLSIAELATICYLVHLNRKISVSALTDMTKVAEIAASLHRQDSGRQDELQRANFALTESLVRQSGGAIVIRKPRPEDLEPSKGWFEAKPVIAPPPEEARKA